MARLPKPPSKTAARAPRAPKAATKKPTAASSAPIPAKQTTLKFPDYPSLNLAIRMLEAAATHKTDQSQALVLKWVSQLKKIQTEIAQLEKLEKLTANLAKMAQTR